MPSATLSLVLAIPDHPWTRATKDAAAVRIAMTVAQAGAGDGRLVKIVAERWLDSDVPVLEESAAQGRINADLTLGTDLAPVAPLLSNKGLAYRGVQLMGSGFILSAQQAGHFGLGQRAGLEVYIRPYVNGRDLLQRSRGSMVIDFFGLTEKEVRQRFPEVYQHLDSTVRVQREAQAQKSPTADAKSYARNFWLYGKPRPELRPALDGLSRYIATVETARHRVFQFVEQSFLPDNKIVVVCIEDAFHLGVFCSSAHQEWAFANCGLIGMASFEAGHVYVKSRTFDPFPFPDATPAQRAGIAELAEELDATRKAALAETPDLTMTEIYNWREKLRGGTPLSPHDEDRARAARAGIVDRLHHQIDAAVAEAYGWPADLSPAEIVARLVALNATRAAEERAGHVRWLRPDYQIPRFAKQAK